MSTQKWFKKNTVRIRLVCICALLFSFGNTLSPEVEVDRLRRMVAEHSGANDAECEFKKIYSLNVKYPGVPITEGSAHFERVLFCFGRQAFVEKVDETVVRHLCRYICMKMICDKGYRRIKLFFVGHCVPDLWDKFRRKV